MEEKNFQWLTRLLCVNRSRLNLLESLFFHSGSLESWAHTDDTGVVRKRNLGEEGVANFAEAVAYFLGKVRKWGRRTGLGTTLCYIVWKGERTTVDASLGEELMNKKDAHSRCHLLQEFRLPRSANHSQFTYRAKYHLQGYRSAAYRLRDGVKQKETSARMIHKMRDVCLVVLSAVEHVKLRRVMDLSLEFMVDEGGDLWLMDAPKCIVATPALCHQPKALDESNGQKVKSQFSKQKTKIYEKDDESTKATLVECKYLFKRGQLRNQRSNLGSPIRIHSPMSSKESRSSDEAVTDLPEKQAFEPQTPKASLLTLRPCKADKFNNSNFQEMLVLNFVKSAGLSPRAAANLEEVHRYMEQTLFASSDPEGPRPPPTLNKYRLSVFRNEDFSQMSARVGLDTDSSSSEKSLEERPRNTVAGSLPSLQGSSKFARFTSPQVRQTTTPKQSGLLSPTAFETAKFTASKSDASLKFKRVVRKSALSPESFDLQRPSHIRGDLLTPVLAKKQRKPLLARTVR